MNCQKKSGPKVFLFSIFQNSKEHSAILAILLSKGSDCELAKIKMRTTTKRRPHMQLRQRSESSSTCDNLSSWTKMLKDDWMVLVCPCNCHITATLWKKNRYVKTFKHRHDLLSTKR